MMTRNTTVAAILVLFTFTLLATAVAPAHAALRGLWRFDDANPANVGKDSSPEGNDLTAYGQAAQTAGAQGKYGEALTLDGNNDWLGIAGDGGGDNAGVPTNVPIGGSPYTVAAWIKPSVGVAGNAGIIGWGNYGGGSQVMAFRLNSTDGLHNYWWGNDLGNGDVLPGADQFTDGTWRHVAATYDRLPSGDDHKVFVNGAQVAQRNSNNAINVRPENFRIGETNGLGEDWLGLLDDVAVFNEALTATQIQTIATGDFSAFTVAPTAITLMDPTTNDGSFESNTINTNGAPTTLPPVWTVTETAGAVGGVLGVTHNALFKTDGIDAMFCDNLTTTATSFNLLGTNGYTAVSEGDVFEWSFDFNSGNLNSGGAMYLDFGNGPVLLGSGTEDNTNLVPYRTISGTYAATAADAAGSQLVVQATLTDVGANIYGDNILLSVTPIPEPSSLVLSALGLLGLLSWRRKGLGI